ncbi:MAG: Rpn family recombination-promoting nuclease/putative transposase [Magnetococcales bacterium]|nr:Rpn family recombination-promoting nuclease/putative transposase [Magnetococcales bacterium]
MSKRRQLISFDWALKRLLRSKANFDILEGFLSELFQEEVRIQEILESESNQAHRHDKFNRVDLKVRNQRDEIILVELQYERELDYLQRLLFGSAKALVEHMGEGQPYRDILKIISVSILYFDLGQGSDYIYHGSTVFRGLHTHDELGLSDNQKEMFHRDSIAAIFPEYYLIKVNRFDDIARDTLDEWIYFLKNEEIRDDFTARGLVRAREQLNILQLPEQERRAYEAYKEDLRDQASWVLSTYGAGRLDGKREGHQEGIEQGLQQGLQQGRQQGLREGTAETLLHLLRKRFGTVPESIQVRVRNAELEVLTGWTDALFEAESLADLFR